MRISRTEKIIKERRDNIEKFCCWKMKKAYYRNYVILGHNKITHKPFLCMPRMGDGNDEQIIFYCPFCGEKVEAL